MKRAGIYLWTGLILISNSLAGVRESLPIFHWVYDYVDELRVHGYFENFYILNKPFTRGRIAEYLIRLNGKINSGELSIKKADRWLFDRLNDEFKPEIQILSQKSVKKQVSFGTYFIQELAGNEDRTVGHSRFRSKLNLRMSDEVEFYNGIVLDNRLDEDPSYLGKRQGGYAAFTEQAYITLGWKNLDFKLGRDFVRFGAGKTGTLMISDQAHLILPKQPARDEGDTSSFEELGSLIISDKVRPMDQFWASYTYKFFKFSFLIVNLDPMMVPDTLSGSMVRANRFLSSHRLEFKLLDRFYFGITESIIYGGPEGNWELAFLNPFIFYHGVQRNGPVEGNTFGSIDFAVYPFKNLSLFGEFLIDDIQLEKSVPADLEPDELGIIFGVQLTDPFKISGTHFFTEYTRITNRTYNAINPWEKFLHRQQPIGHFLGNDFDRWDINLSQWVLPGLRFSLGFERIRRGEGRIRNEFDRPWLNLTVEEGYSEPFPTGIVEKTNAAKFEIIYHPRANLRFNLFGKFKDVKNIENRLGVTNSEFTFVLGLWYEGDFRLKF